MDPFSSTRPEQLKLTPTEDLRHLLDEVEAMLRDIRSELQRREAARQDWHIDHLEDHLAEARGGWGRLKQFLNIVLGDLRKK